MTSERDYEEYLREQSAFINQELSSVTISEDQRRVVLGYAQKAANAAVSDSNDDEIEALQDALSEALSLLGLTMPDPQEESE